MIATRQVDVLGAALLAGAFLLPPGDAPWFSFWREWAAALAVLLIVLSAFSRIRFERLEMRFVPASLPGLAFGLAVVPWLQWVFGLEPYRGDALLVSLYLVGFGACMVVARAMAPEERERLADRLAMAMLGAALCSVPLAWLQWLGVLRLDMGIPVAAGRPIAHMEQTNLLCTLLLQGLLGAWRLHERRRLGERWLAALGLVLLLTCDLTQSRVAWLVLVATAIVFFWRRKALGLQGRGAWLAVAALVIGAGALAMPWADARLGLTGMSLGDRLTGGRRPDAWLLFLDAVGEHPWVGWGALRNGAAQFALADRHPALMWLFSSAHDLVLDLMVWFGAPIGLVAGGALIVALILRIRRAGDPASLATCVAAMALLLHGLVELPLQYTYFLFPLGLMLGVQGDVGTGASRGWRLPVHGAAALAAAAIVPALLLALLARDYIPLSDYRPFMTYDKPTRHMVLAGVPLQSDPLLLDQLRDFQAFAAVPVAAGLDAATIASLRPPMLRFPFGPSQERFARLLALNGRGAEAVDALKRSCTFMTPDQCEANRRAWRVWQSLGQPLPDWP